ncbi:MAG TPA: nucleotide sugar dehydrogenase [Bryobacteraceae bacterium]
MMRDSPKNVAVFGLGYVGCVTAACLAELGHRVTGVDRDEGKVHSISQSQAPFYEPGLGEIVGEAVRSGRLRATQSPAEALHQADIALICVGTPSERNGNLGLEQLRRVLQDIRDTVARSSPARPPIVAVRSTVFPGTCEEVVIPALAACPGVRVVSNPEFLREGSAVRDFREPSLIVVGGSDADAVRQTADLYQALGVAAQLVSLRTAEMIKYACNAFHAVKISFANEMGALAAPLGVDPAEVMRTLCQDVRLNISPAYLQPGFAFGGSCLPKDLRALTYRASRLDLNLPFLESVLASNQEHLRRAIQDVFDLGPQRLGVVGLAFKENTDDLRESPVVTLLEFLIGKGRDVRVYDPHIRLDRIYGSNRDYILNAIPHIGRLLTANFLELTSWATHLVVAQNPGAELALQIRASGLPVFNLTAPGPPLMHHAVHYRNLP